MKAFPFDVLERERSRIKVLHTVKHCTSVSPQASAVSSNIFPSRGPTPAVSANGTTSGTVWALDLSTGGRTTTQSPDAYDATNVSNLLFSGPAIGSGASGVAVKFKVLTVANGKVYVGGRVLFIAFGLPHTPAQSLVPL